MNIQKLSPAKLILILTSLLLILLLIISASAIISLVEQQHDLQEALEYSESCEQLTLLQNHLTELQAQVMQLQTVQASPSQDQLTSLESSIQESVDAIGSCMSSRPLHRYSNELGNAISSLEGVDSMLGSLEQSPVITAEQFQILTTSIIQAQFSITRTSERYYDDSSFDIESITKHTTVSIIMIEIMAMVSVLIGAILSGVISRKIRQAIDGSR